MRAIQFRQTGGPEVLELVELSEPSLPGDGLLVDVKAAGVNFLDIYLRRGNYPATLPMTPGDEGVGIVRAVGAAVGGFSPGDRVAWTGGQGAYAEVAVVPAATTIRLPDAIDDGQALILAQGLTAHYLTHDVARLVAGDAVLVHAGAGGVGRLLTRMLTIRGVSVLATVSTGAKAAVAREAGATATLILGSEDVDRWVRSQTGGRGVRAAFDGVGRDTFDASLASVARCGTLVLFGASSGPVPSIDPMRLAHAGSVALIRPRLADYICRREAFETRVTELFRWVAAGKLECAIGGRFPLERAAEAHQALESRATSGKLILEMSGT